MVQPTGIHHLAVMTSDIKAQIEFFTQVLGLPLVALYDMHGVEGAWHGFVELEQGTYLAFCQVPGVDAVESTVGVTHAGHGGGVSAAGTMQHVALKARTEADLLAVRDRLRSHGVVVFGPIDHGMCESIYFAGPEGLTLEVAWSANPIAAAHWVDPAVAAAAGMSADDVERFRTPTPFEVPAEPVAQPAFDPSRPRLAYPQADYESMVTLPDEVIRRSASVPVPPVP